MAPNKIIMVVMLLAASFPLAAAEGKPDPAINIDFSDNGTQMFNFAGENGGEMREGSICFLEEAEVDSTGDNTAGAILNVGDNVFFFRCPGNTFVLGWKDSSGNNCWRNLAGNFKFVPGKQYLWSATWTTSDTGDLIKKLYINGMLIDAQTAKKSSTYSLPSPNRLNMPERPGQSKLYNVHVYTTCLALEQLLAIYKLNIDQAELICNPSFEYAGNSLPWGWNRDVWGIGDNDKRDDYAIFSIDQKGRVAGENALKITSLSRRNPVVMTRVPLKRGHKYSLRFAAKETGLKKEVQVIVQSRGLRQYRSFCVVDAWKTFNYDFTGMADDDESIIYFCVGGQIGILWLDDLSIKDSAPTQVR